MRLQGTWARTRVALDWDGAVGDQLLVISPSTFTAAEWCGLQRWNIAGDNWYGLALAAAVPPHMDDKVQAC